MSLLTELVTINYYILTSYRHDTISNQLAEISVNYQESFAQCLEPITATLRSHSSTSAALPSTSGVRTTSQQTSNTSSIVEAASSSSSKAGGLPFNATGHHKRSTSSGAQHYFQTNFQRY